MPLHSWEHSQIPIHQIAHSLCGILDSEKTTVVLGWGDFLNRRTRQALEGVGFHVECNGYRGGSWIPQSGVGDRANFLPNLLDLFLNHDRLVVDTVSTALVYGHSIGMPSVLDPRLRDLMHGTVQSSGGTRGVALGIQRNRLNAQAEYRWLYESAENGGPDKEKLALALGADCLRAPDELADILHLAEIPPELRQV